MPASDIVLDTNIMVQANNPALPNNKSSVSFLKKIVPSTVQLCVDEGFDLVESKNRSQIGRKYVEHVRFGMLGYAVLATLAQNGRIKIISKTVPSQISRQIRQMVNDVSDHVFARITYNSDEKYLASHDMAAYPLDSRPNIERGIGITILLADEAEQLI